jgi:hypothetical protein
MHRLLAREPFEPAELHPGGHLTADVSYTAAATRCSGSHLKFLREVHCTKKCCTQSTLVGDRALAQGRTQLRRNQAKHWLLSVRNVRGGFFPNIGSTGSDAGRYQGATAEKAVPFPSVARRSQFFLGRPAARAAVRVGIRPHLGDGRPQLAGPRHATRLARLAALG